MTNGIKNQEITSLEITEAIIERIQKINPIINAYCTPTFDIAREMAKEADNLVKQGKKVGLLNGIPTSIKDLMYTKGIRTTFGSLIYENYIPAQDQIDVKRLKEAGCVLLGKTNTPEFGHFGHTRNKIFGATKNPWNLERTCGGSSGGAAAAVAAGISPLALGSDGGGSIRDPASLCGIYGLKPTFGRIPVYPKNGVQGYSISHHGPLTRYIEDAALMLDVMKGFHEFDRDSLPDDNISYTEHLDELPKTLKIAFSLDMGIAKVVHPDVERAVSNAVTELEQFGWTIETPKMKIKNPVLAFNTIFTALYAADLAPKLKKWRDKMEPSLVKFIEAGLSFPATALLKAFKQRKVFHEKFNKFMKDYDILITPTVAIPAFKLGIDYPAEIDGKNVSPTGWQPYAPPFNLTGNPAASIPCGFSKDGLPIGMQIVGHRYEDLLVLQVSKAFQDVAPWQDKKPQFG